MALLDGRIPTMAVCQRISELSSAATYERRMIFACPISFMGSTGSTLVVLVETDVTEAADDSGGDSGS